MMMLVDNKEEGCFSYSNEALRCSLEKARPG